MSGMWPLILFVSGGMALFLALSALAGRVNWKSMMFAYFATAMGIWSLGLGVYLLTDNVRVMSVSVAVYYIAAAMLIHGYLLFSYTLRTNRRVSGWTLGLTSLVFVVVVLLAVTDNLVTVSPTTLIDRLKNVEILMPGYLIYTLYFAVYAVASLYNFYVAYRMAPGRKERRRLLIIGITMSFSLVFGSLFNLILPFFGNYSLIMVGPVFILPIVVVIYWLIVRHGLFDVRLAAVRTLAYIMSLGVMAAVYFGAAYLISQILFQGASTTGVSMSPVNILLALVLAFIFQPIKQFFDHVTDRIFYHDRYDIDELVVDLGTTLTSSTDMRLMLERTSGLFDEVFGTRGTSFLVWHDDGQVQQVGSKGYRIVTKSLREALAVDLEDIETATLATTESPTRVLRDMARYHVGVVLPLRRRDELIGVMLLGEESGRRYTRRDVEILDAVSDELLIAIQNVRSIQTVSELNANLEARVTSATRRLQTSNNKLRRLDETKDEFIGMASHQLRTPLTSIKGYLSMVLDGDAGEISDQQRRLLNEAFLSSERMVHLIGDFLNVSRLQTGKFMIDCRPSDLGLVVQQEVEQIASMAASHAMTVVYKRPKRLDTLMIDEDKVRQVIMNFIDNAIYYSRPNSTIVVKLYQKDKKVFFEVHDQGIGVPKAVQARLFRKFFRAENAQKQRPDGTGIGLYLAKQVIDAQDGDMIFESTEGKGSVFGFWLPLP